MGRCKNERKGTQRNNVVTWICTQASASCARVCACMHECVCIWLFCRLNWWSILKRPLHFLWRGLVPRMLRWIRWKVKHLSVCLGQIFFTAGRENGLKPDWLILAANYLMMRTATPLRHLFHQAYSATCLAAGVLCQSVIQVNNSGVNKRIMENKLAMQPHKGPGHSGGGSAMFSSPLFCAYCLLQFPNDHFPPAAFMKDWHGRNWLSGTRSLEPLRSMGVLWAFPPFRETRGPKDEEKTDYHSINKTNHNLKQEQRQKAASVFSPRKSLGRTHRRTLADTRTCTHACIHACNGIVPQKGSFIQVQHAVMEAGRWKRDNGKRRTMPGNARRRNTHR